MKIFIPPTLVGILASGILLAGHALYFNSMSVAVADGLVFLLMVVCWSYLLNQGGASKKSLANEEPDTGSQTALPDNFKFIQESSAFHVQLGNEMSEQLNSAHTELGNTQEILNDAIVKLVSNFIAISDGVRGLSEHSNSFSAQVRQLIDDVRSTLASSDRITENQAPGEAGPSRQSNRHVKAMLADFTAFNEIVTQNAIDLNTINTKVEQNVLVVISTLQFQDMSSQLIEHARMRMTALQAIANEMGKGGDSLTHREYLEQIAAYNRLLQQHVMSMNRGKANPVAQKDFGTGDIELF